MDYTKIPRSIIYMDIKDIGDFDIDGSPFSESRFVDFFRDQLFDLAASEPLDVYGVDLREVDVAVAVDGENGERLAFFECVDFVVEHFGN